MNARPRIIYYDKPKLKSVTLKKVFPFRPFLPYFLQASVLISLKNDLKYKILYTINEKYN